MRRVRVACVMALARVLWAVAPSTPSTGRQGPRQVRVGARVWVGRAFQQSSPANCGEAHVRASSTESSNIPPHTTPRTRTQAHDHAHPPAPPAALSCPALPCAGLARPPSPPAARRPPRTESCPPRCKRLLRTRPRPPKLVDSTLGSRFDHYY